MRKFGAPERGLFSKRVIEKALAIPPGRVTTYGRLARAAGGGPMAAQSITAILGKAWEAGEKRIPFHRIVYTDGRVWIDDAHAAERMRLYKKEGIELDARGKIADFKKKLFDFS
jgi:methylated-DNA-protein-cysteine methyltransferase-like protein